MTVKHLKKLVSKLPSKSGIYFFQTADNRNIYIGKAASLKKRVLNYTKTEDDRIRKMVETAKSLEYITTDSDIEAMILESQYIKKHRPMFNIVMRDDKQYFYVGFSKDKFQRIFLTHQLVPSRSALSSRPKCFSRDSKTCPEPFGIELTAEMLLEGFKTVSDFEFRASNFSYIGPFIDGSAIKTTLQYLRRIFPYCTCKQPHNNYCLNYHIGKCLGFCCLKQQKPNSNLKSQSEKLYKKNIQAIKDILIGKRKSLIKKLEKEMISQAKNHNFKEAISLRNKLEKLKRVFQNAQIIKDNKYIDISIYQYDKKIIELLKEKLGLEKLPRRIEAYDVSNIQGQNATGSMVVFTLQQNSGQALRWDSGQALRWDSGQALRQDSRQAEWKPDKSEYRRFKIRNVSTSQDGTLNSGDTGMLKEVFTRRFKHPEWPMPDLIIVDGGKGQLSVAKKAISNLKFKIFNESSIKQLPEIIALTKNEKHFGVKLNTQNGEILLSSLPLEVRNLILHIGSEAHRFAINYYRKLHRKSLHTHTIN